MKLRYLVLACAMAIALVFVKAEKAEAGGYVSIGPYGVHIGTGYGYYGHPYQSRPNEYLPYYGDRSYYYRPYRKPYPGSYYYPNYGYYYYPKHRYYRKYRKHRRHYRRAHRHHRHYYRW